MNQIVIKGAYSFKGEQEVRSYLNTLNLTELGVNTAVNRKKKDAGWSNILREINRATTTNQKKGIFGKAVSIETQNLIPIEPQIWLACHNNIVQAMNFFKTNENKMVPLTQKWTDNLGDVQTIPATSDELSLYKQIVNDFRKLSFMNKSWFKIQSGVIETTIHPGNYAATIGEMLRDMIKKTYGNGNGMSVGTGCGHWEIYERIIKDPTEMTAVELMKRGSHRVQGFNEDGSRRGEDEYGLLLLTTAIAFGIQKHGIDVEELEATIESLGEEKKKAFRIAILEQQLVPQISAAKRLTNTGNQNPTTSQLKAETERPERVGNFLAQQAAIDPVFNSYYLLFRIASGKANNANLSNIAIGLEPALLSNYGKLKLVNFLKAAPIPELPILAKLLAQPKGDHAIYCPPWVPTAQRLRDFAMCLASNIPTKPREFWNPSSTRVFSNVSSTDSKTFEIIARMFMAEKETDENWSQDGHILSSEHVLHQVLLGRTSPFQWLGNRQGNALRVNVA